jgi:hypothetical protein
MADYYIQKQQKIQDKVNPKVYEIDNAYIAPETALSE